jgi:hypothetical protein
VGRDIPRTATRVEARLVALLSSIQSTPSTSATGWRRCSGASKERSPASIPAAPAPASRAASAAASALAALCRPRMRSSAAGRMRSSCSGFIRRVSHPSSSTNPPVSPSSGAEAARKR